MSGTATILFKPVSSLCNLSCGYCYYDQVAAKGRFPESKLDYLVDFVSKMLNGGIEGVKFIWHGGEPLLAGKDFFRKTCERLKSSFDDRVRLGIQTNGTLLDQEWCDLLNDFDMSAGLSLDGPSRLHDLVRTDNKGNGSFTSIIKSIRLLEKNNIEYGVLSVVNSYSIGKAQEIFDFFLKEKIFRYDFLPCYCADDNCLVIEPNKWADFMIEYFDHWFFRDDERIKIRFFEEIIRVLLGGKISLCALSDSCGSFFTIESNGNIYPCDDFVMDGQSRLGNIQDATFESVKFKADLKSSRKNDLKDRYGCWQCEFLQFCGGGCHRFEESFGMICKARKKLFSYIKSTTKVYIEGVT